MYELHKRLILVHKGEQSVAEDTITRGGEEEGETWKKTLYDRHHEIPSIFR